MGRLDDFRYANWAVRLNRLAQILLTLILLGGLNWLATQSFSRFDLTRGSQHSLAPETRGYLRELAGPVEIFVTVTPDGGLGEDEGPHMLGSVDRYLRYLLEEYQHATRQQPDRAISVEFINVFQDVRRAGELERRFGVAPPNVVIVAAGQRQKLLNLTDLVDLEEGELRAYRGEQAITSAILEVSDPEGRVLYFLSGHAEMQLDDVDPRRGLSLWAEQLRQRNIRALPLDLTQNPAVPEDAGAVVAIGPQGRLLPTEVAALREYLDQRNGRLLLALGLGSTQGYDDLLYEWGILADDQLVVDRDEMSSQSASGDLVLRQLADHPATRLLLRNQIPLLAGLCRPVRPDPGAPLDERLTVVPLVASSKSSWGERGYRQGGFVYDEQLDLNGPVPVVSVAERRVASQLGINLPGGRVLVVGCADIFANQRLTLLGNSMFALHSVQWLLDADSALLDLPVRPVDTFQLPLSRRELTHLAGLFLVLPGGVAALGILVYLFRRR